MLKRVLGVFLACNACFCFADEKPMTNLMAYTIVLAPEAERSAKYIEVSCSLCGDHQPSYLLASDGTSSPHITVVQFRCSEQLAEEVWTRLSQKLQEAGLTAFEPPFVGVAFVDGAGPYAGTTWVELSVKRGEVDSPIMQMHLVAASVLEEFGIAPLNACGNNYRPHLTLGRIVMPEQLKTWPQNLLEDTGPFHIEFGMSDAEWQYALKLGALTQ